MPFEAPRPAQPGILFGLLMLAVLFAACGGGGARLSEEGAAGVVRAKLGLENPGYTIHCEVREFRSEENAWTVRCSLTNVLGKRWSDWSVDDRTLEVTQLPGGEPGFPTAPAQ